MYVTGFQSGTEAIISLLNHFEAEQIILAEDLCPDYVKAITSLNCEVFIAPVSSVGLTADYESIYIKTVGCRKKTAVLFSHPYGIYDREALEKLNAKLKKDDIIINDCCLCSPMHLISGDLLLPAVFSFGYSKVLDLDGGGLLLSGSRPAVHQEPMRVCREIERFGITYSFDFELYLAMNWSEFSETSFFKNLSNYSQFVFSEKERSRSYLRSVFRSFEYIDSDWRFVIKSGLTREGILELQAHAKRQGVFLGANYPLIRLKNGEVSVDVMATDNMGWPINIFTDFRVDELHIRTVSELVKGRLCVSR